jgi:hypothetical protein
VTRRSRSIPKARSPTRSPQRREKLPDALLAAGVHAFTTDEAAAAAGIKPESARPALARLIKNKLAFSPARGLYIPIPPEYRTAAGDDAFDRVATACVDQSADCPSGMLAIVLDAAVVSAPIVQTPIFDGEFTISGDFTEDEAGSIADALSP